MDRDGDGITELKHFIIAGSTILYEEDVDNIKDWDELGHSENWLGNARYSEDIAARKYVTGQEYWQGSVSQDLFPLEANREVTVTECWLRVDRDGDGITELKHFIICLLYTSPSPRDS